MRMCVNKYIHIYVHTGMYNMLVDNHIDFNPNAHTYVNCYVIHSQQYLQEVKLLDTVLRNLGHEMIMRDDVS